MGHERRVGSAPKHSEKVVAFAAAFVAAFLTLSSAVIATHEADHRFTVEGFVCGPDGQPVTDEKVIVKDTRVSVTATAYTDGSGYYKAVLHLHDDNVGDPLLVKVQGKEQRAKVEFDPKDHSTERAISITFGAGCEARALSPGPWVYYSAGIVVVLVAAYAGVRMVRSQRRLPGRKGKKAGKGR